MAANNIRILKGGYTVQRFRAESNAYVGFAAGDAANVAGTGTNYAIPALDGTPTRGTNVFIGITHSAATNTASADGVVDVELCGAGTILEAKATTAANVNTDAKLLGMLCDTTNFDRTAATVAGVLSFDETNTTAQKSSTLSFVILDGDIVKGTLKCALTGGGIIGGSNI